MLVEQFKFSILVFFPCVLLLVRTSRHCAWILNLKLIFWSVPNLPMMLLKNCFQVWTVNFLKVSSGLTETTTYSDNKQINL